MSLLYNNDPFWSFFDNINDEVNNFNNILNRARTKPKQTGKGSKEVAKSDNNNNNSRALRPWSADPFFSNNSLFKFGDSSMDLTPPVDIIDNEKAYELHVSVPGAPKDNITIDFNKDDNELVIKGTIPSSRPAEEQDEGNSDHYIERYSGKFERSITLPAKVDGENIKATFENGVLKLDVPKVEANDKNKFKRILISSSESYSS